MATAIMKQKEVPETDDVEEIISKISEESPYKRRPTQKRTWMTVPEMGKLLGLKKTDRYWLVHKNVFESKEIAGKIRINIASFEKWYANQIKYHKVTGEEPGKELKSWSYSVKEVADLLDVDDYLVYELLKKNQMEAVIVDYWKRIPKESFQNWYKSQSQYRTKEDREKDALLEEATITMPEMAQLLGTTRSAVYTILDNPKYSHFFEFIGDAKLSEINTRFIERYYQSLLKKRAVINPLNKTSRNEFVSSSTVRDVNKLLRNCFEQAVKWELMEKNPCTHATVPKHKSQKRDIWTADTLMYALSVCEDERLKLAINLSFSCSLRLGELLGLTWDCVDISHEAIEENRAYVFINKELQRIRKESLNALDGKDVLLVFPTNHKKNSTVRILKTPKTESSVRKIFLPKSVANMLVDWKVEQDEMKEILGDEYMDYNLVMASTFGLPLGDGAIRGPLKKLIEDYNLPPVVFHSFRHSSVTYKLKLNGGDIKAVQGDSGHAQVNMVTDVYSHILDDDRRKNAELFEEAFYEKKNLDPQMHVQQENNNATVADEVNPELLAKVLANPEMRALLNSLAKTMK